MPTKPSPIHETILLSDKSEQRYQAMSKDFENKNKIYMVNDSKQLIKNLDEDSLYKIVEGDIWLYDIGTHNQVY